MWLWFIGFALALMLLRELWLLLLLPVAARVAMLGGDRARARRILERVVAAPSLWGERGKLEVRFRLAWLYLEEKRFADAIEQCRAILQRRLKPAVEANVRRRLADCLEAAGKVEEAHAERRQAAGLVAAAPDDAEKFLSQAQMLEEQGQHAAACEAYERGLALIPRWNDAARKTMMVKLALCAYHAGRPDAALRWAEEAIALKPDPMMLMLAHSAAGLAYSTQGNLEAAENHRQQAFQLATALGNQDQAAHFLVQLADVQMKRGKLVQAVQACEQAAGLSLKVRRQARMLQAECLRLWGRLAEARETLEQASRAPGLPVPSAERRAQAVIALQLALIAAEENQPQTAFGYLKQATAELQKDEKLSLVHEATAAWILALLNRREEVEQKIAHIEARLPQFVHDRVTQGLCYGLLGQATFDLQDFERSQGYWERYLALQPDPVVEPIGWYHLGECRRHVGDRETAKAKFQQAVNLGIDTHHTRLAQQRLEELTSSLAR
ncbi:MAG: tetratricopeptide repeat protein [Abditibacteriales bacterium]|nr:tetratricopeptide repeat protein [Abditibacteriales bacterium]MDW8368175.1 tetratricopeptide repeat protein [Abditibacteriales bacterium]